MKFFNQITHICLMTFLVISFFQCVSTQKLEKSFPITFGDVYSQDWVSDDQKGVSDFDIHITIIENPNNVILDSVYHKNKKAKLELEKDNIFIGHFKSETNNKQDLIMSNEPFAEYGNSIPKLPQKTPFKLNEDECVVSYMVGDEVKYFKIENIARKESKNDQQTPPN